MQSGEVYVYRKNANGDITHIYTAGGELAGRYVYDAWGNHSVHAAAGYEELARRNAFRYNTGGLTQGDGVKCDKRIDKHLVSL